MKTMDNKRISKFLSLVLRHRPDKIGIKLDNEGWANIDELLSKVPFGALQLYETVDSNDKQRFTISPCRGKIRAAQGHSINVDLKYKETEPPMWLYHGTSTKKIDLILEEGLKPMKRTHVHLSQDIETAMKVGSRHGTPAAFVIDALWLHERGHKFYKADNGVWLTGPIHSRNLVTIHYNVPS